MRFHVFDGTQMGRDDRTELNNYLGSYLHEEQKVEEKGDIVQKGKKMLHFGFCVIRRWELWAKFWKTVHIENNISSNGEEK